MITFFTCCDQKYVDFVPFFASSILYHNVNSQIEIGIEDDLSHYNSLMIDYLNEKYNNRILVRRVNFGNININGRIYGSCPNVIRFIEEPITKNEYVYISDIDIITLEGDILEMHLKNMESNNINYSNILRPYNGVGFKRLSGLHFTKWDSYYPIGDYENFAKKSLLGHDESFLYEIVSTRNKIDEKITFRPVHGIHISPNREPSGWGIPKFKEKWKLYRNSVEFRIMEKLTTDKMKDYFKKIDEY